MNTWEVISLIVLGLLLALVAGALALVAVYIRKIERAFVQIDSALVPFGQSGAGRFINDNLAQLRVAVDQPTDSAVIKLSDLLNSIHVVTTIAGALGVAINYESVASWGRRLFDVLDELTDGESTEGLPLAEREPDAPARETWTQ